MLDGPTLNTTPPVGVQLAEANRARPQDEGHEEAEKEQDFVFDGQKLDTKPSVVIEE